MLKGLSHKEIASIRDASESTVRQQARAIYGKANLSGRAALSAFFLERPAAADQPEPVGDALGAADRRAGSGRERPGGASRRRPTGR